MPIVVYAHDHRSHGASLAAGAEPGELGAGGWGELVLNETNRDEVVADLVVWLDRTVD